jgi:hypothetical protein
MKSNCATASRPLSHDAPFDETLKFRELTVDMRREAGGNGE